MPHEVAPALAGKFGEPGGLFDTVLQRLVSEWHRFQLDRDPERLAALGAILEAGLSQLRSLELLLGTADEPETELARDLEPSPRSEPDIRSVYAAEPRARPERPPSDREAVSGAPSPARLHEAMRLLESLHDALQDALSLGEVPSRPPAGPEPESRETAPPEPLEHPELAPREPLERPDAEPGEPPQRPDAAAGPTEEAEPVAELGGAGSVRPIDEIFSHEAFDVASAAELKRCRRFERAFSLLLLDAGIEVDQRAGRILLSNLREFDLVGRYGRDVLAVGLPETSAEGARLIAQRLVGLLARRGAWSDRGRLGVATYPRDGNTLTTVVRSARAQLSGGAPA